MGFTLRDRPCELEAQFAGVRVLFTMGWHQLVSRLEVEGLKLEPDA